MGRRSKRRGVLVAAIAALLLLIGGVSLLGGGEEGDGDSPRPQPAAPAEDATSLAERADLFWGRLHLLRECLADARVGEAWGYLERLRELDLSGEQEKERAGARDQLGRATDAALARLARSVARGRILEADENLRGLLTPTHPEVTAALGDLCRGRGWPDLVRASSLEAAPDLPEPAPLAARQRVRFRFQDAWRTGDVTRATSGGSVSVRVSTPAGVFFPSLGRTLVEPVEPSAPQVAAQLRMALRRGDGQLACLWLAHAVEGRLQLDSHLVRLATPPGR